MAVFTFDQIFAVDPYNHERVASNGFVTIFLPGDPTQTPLAGLMSVSGAALPNPIQVNAQGIGPAFSHATIDRVAWTAGGLSGYFTSYEGLKQVATDAATAAQDLLVQAQSGAFASGMYPVYEVNGTYTRPTTLPSHVSVIFTGVSDPGSLAHENDRWERLT